MWIMLLYTLILVLCLNELIHSHILDSLSQSIQEYTTDIKYGQQQYFIKRPEGERTYYAYIPTSYTGTTAVSVHMSYHGLGGECQQFAQATGFNDMAEQYNFIHVYPKASEGYLGPGWNAGTCCIGADVDDIQFTQDVLNDVESKYNIDRQHIYGAGFSNGAFMCETLGCTIPNIFAGIASVSGDTVITGGITQCDKLFSQYNTSMSVLHIHGDSDNIVPYDGSSILGFPDIPTEVQAWAKRNNCNPQSKQTLNAGTFVNQVWDECADNGKVELVTNRDGGHTWPRTAQFNTSDYIVNFFNSLKPRHMFNTGDQNVYTIAIS